MSGTTTRLPFSAARQMQPLQRSMLSKGCDLFAGLFIGTGQNMLRGLQGRHLYRKVCWVVLPHAATSPPTARELMDMSIMSGDELQQMALSYGREAAKHIVVQQAMAHAALCRGRTIGISKPSWRFSSKTFQSRATLQRSFDEGCAQRLWYVACCACTLHTTSQACAWAIHRLRPSRWTPPNGRRPAHGGEVATGSASA